MELSNTWVTSLSFFPPLPYRIWVEFAFATNSGSFLLLFQYVRALFEWGQPSPIRPGAKLTSADLIESTTWVKLKQAEAPLPRQPQCSTLRTHFTMRCDFAPDKWWNEMKSNKWVHFGRLLLKRFWLKTFQCWTRFWLKEIQKEKKNTPFSCSVYVNINAFWVKLFPCLPSAVMDWHSMPFSILNGIFVKALWIQHALSLRTQTLLREEKICEWNLSL